MKKELQDKLFEKYPKVFRQRDLPMQQTCMCWGITCGDGWYNILDVMCAEIQHHLEHNASKDEGTISVEATQVKEKYGGLRFYYNGGDDLIRGLVCMAEGLSYCTCEECGSPGTQNDESWISTLCDSCRENIVETRKRSVEEAAQRFVEDHETALQMLAHPIDEAIMGQEPEYEEEIELYKTFGGD
jgi:hypothetical protein